MEGYDEYEEAHREGIKFNQLCREAVEAQEYHRKMALKVPFFINRAEDFEARGLLQEARAQYGMALPFSSGNESRRLAEKIREIELKLEGMKAEESV